MTDGEKDDSTWQLASDDGMHSVEEEIGSEEEEIADANYNLGFILYGSLNFAAEGNWSS